jgi:signal peptidase
MNTKIKKTGKITKKIVHIKLTLIVLIILPIAVFTLLTSKSSYIAGVRSMVVLSGSMEPHISTGSVVYIKPEKSYRSGDVVTFNTDSGMTVTHRIVGEKIEDDGTKFITKGDANAVNDTEVISHSQITGKTLFSLPYIGYVVNFLKTPKGFLLAIIIPTFVFIGLEMWAIKKEIEKSVEKRIMDRIAKQQV